MKTILILGLGIASLVVSGCVTVDEKPVTSETVTTTEETRLVTPAATETRVIRSY